MAFFVLLCLIVVVIILSMASYDHIAIQSTSLRSNMIFLICPADIYVANVVLIKIELKVYHKVVPSCIDNDDACMGGYDSEYDV